MFSLQRIISSGNRLPFVAFARLHTATGIIAKSAVYEKFGNVDEVVSIHEEELLPPQKNEILIKMIAAPINPADINMIEGVYSLKPNLPSVGGNEGVAVVVNCGNEVKGLKPGDWVIPSKPLFGTWCTHAVCGEDDVDLVDNTLLPEQAATIAVNPCTAYRMLHDFVDLTSSSSSEQAGGGNKQLCIIQNGATSAVGLCVIQIAKTMGVKTINVVRNRPNLDEVVEKLKGLGATVVVTEEQLSNTKQMREILEKEGLYQPVLGLNCVGGQSSTDIARILADNAPLVTYGGMSKKPVQVPTGRLIFNNIALRGFWLSRWTLTNNKQTRQKMLATITDLFKKQQLQSFVEKIPFDSFELAMKRAREPYRANKVLLTFDEEQAKTQKS